MMTCGNCGHPTSLAYVSIADCCPSCGTSPFVEKIAQDPEHISLPPGVEAGEALVHRNLSTPGVWLA